MDKKKRSFKPRKQIKNTRQGGANSAHLLAGGAAGYAVGKAVGKKVASAVSRKRVAKRAAALAKERFVQAGGSVHGDTTYNKEISRAIKDVNRAEYGAMRRIPQAKYDLYKKLVVDAGSNKKAIENARKVAGISKGDVRIVREKRAYKTLGNDINNLKNAGKMAEKRIAGKYGRRGGIVGLATGIAATWLAGEVMKKRK